MYGNVTASINPEQITEVLPGNVVAKQLQVGSTVLAHLHNGHEVEAKITKIVDSVAGRKVHIAFEPYAFKVEEKQIVKEMRGGH